MSWWRLDDVVGVGAGAGKERFKLLVEGFELVIAVNEEGGYGSVPFVK